MATTKRLDVHAGTKGVSGRRMRREHWSTDVRKQRLMEWLLTPKRHREPATQEQFAIEMGVSSRVVRDWTLDPVFRQEWNDRAIDLAQGPERTQAIFDMLYEKATDPYNNQQVQAAKLYLEATASIRPPTMEVTVKRATELSDEELDQLLADAAASVIASGRGSDDDTLGDVGANARGDDPLPANPTSDDVGTSEPKRASSASD